jgi:hypothetical protein
VRLRRKQRAGRVGAWGACGGWPTTKVAYYVAALITKVAYIKR